MLTRDDYRRREAAGTATAGCVGAAGGACRERESFMVDDYGLAQSMVQQVSLIIFVCCGMHCRLLYSCAASVSDPSDTMPDMLARLPGKRQGLCAGAINVPGLVPGRLHLQEAGNKGRRVIHETS